MLGASLDWTLPSGSDDGMWAFAPHLVMPSKARYRLGGGHGGRGEGGVWELALTCPTSNPVCTLLNVPDTGVGSALFAVPKCTSLKGNLSYSEPPVILLSHAYAFFSASPFEGYVKNRDPNKLAGLGRPPLRLSWPQFYFIPLVIPLFLSPQSSSSRCPESRYSRLGQTPFSP